ncbi:MAG: DUF4421 domain-containing protein [Prevotellaceae bacterium]|nr:DUF4421 domain-containing protein [Prevotellaceae bacterium]
MKRFFIFVFLISLFVPSSGQTDSLTTDSVVTGNVVTGNAMTEKVMTDSVVVKRKVKKNTIFRRIGKAFTKVFKGFNEIDTNYIEPQHYNYTVMLQNTTTYELYTLKSKSGQSITFAPDPTVKLGPYVGWRWVFLGYTLDISHMSSGNKKKELDLSLYSSMFGIDLYYRKMGDDYSIREASLSDGVDKNLLKGVPFSGLSVGIQGFDIYYIFNHHKFSYPAAFSQSTCQKRSCGSPLVGIGYTAHKIDLDYESLKDVVESNLQSHGYDEVKLDSGLMFNKVRYSSYSVSGGYAYNWVFAPNFLFAASLSVALAYKRSTGDLQRQSFSFRDFRFDDFNIDGIGRFGIVWNNTKYYVGASTILHSFNYRKSQFSTNHMFGSLNIYVGVNIGRK